MILKELDTISFLSEMSVHLFKKILRKIKLLVLLTYTEFKKNKIIVPIIAVILGEQFIIKSRSKIYRNNVFFKSFTEF